MVAAMRNIFPVRYNVLENHIHRLVLSYSARYGKNQLDLNPSQLGRMPNQLALYCLAAFGRNRMS